MMPTVPRVTVLLAVYNGETYLREAVDSILAQTFTDFELLAVDDGSTDQTPAILADYVARDSRVRVLTNTHNIGLTCSLNVGLREAQGVYIARHDADDRSMPERLARQVAVLDAEPHVALVTGAVEIIDAEGAVVHRFTPGGSPALIRWYLLFYNAIGGHGAIMFRRDRVRDLGGYDESFRYTQDYELWTRLAACGDFRLLPDLLLRWRQHPAGISTRQQAEQTALAEQVAGREQGQLLGAPPAPEAVELARRFWWRQDLLAVSLPALDAHLWRLYHAFIAGEPDAAPAIRAAVAQRYLDCAGGRPYARRWTPLPILTDDARRWPGRVWRSLGRRVNITLSGRSS